MQDVAAEVAQDQGAPDVADDVAPDVAEDAGMDAGEDAAADAAMDVPMPMDVPQSIADEMQRLFTGHHCAGSHCHGSGMAGGMDLRADSWHSALVGQASNEVPRLLRVSPGDPDNSYLIYKIEATMAMIPECMAMPGVCGTRMPPPPGHSILPSSTRARVREWILMGAPAPGADGGAEDAAADAAGD